MMASDFALDELFAVVHNPANRTVGKAGRGRVLTRPLGHALGCVDVADRRARSGCRKGGTAGVGEEVQNIDRTACAADLFHNKIPVDRLLGEQAGVLERHGLELEGQLLIRDRPLLGQAANLPLTAARRRAMIDRVCAVPEPVFLGARPDGLGVGTLQEFVTPALELFPAAAVQYLVVRPLVCNPHRFMKPPSVFCLFSPNFARRYPSF